MHGGFLEASVNGQIIVLGDTTQLKWLLKLVKIFQKVKSWKKVMYLSTKSLI